jgi:hypothetical protein
MKLGSLNSFTATSLRLTLSISLFVIVILGGVIFSFADRQLKAAATDVSHVVIDANASRNNVQTLQKIQQELKDNKDVIAQANSIVADSQSYQYQDQIVSDLNKYAAQAGITITNLDFSAVDSSSSGSTGTKTPGTTSPTVTTPAGVKTTSVAVTMNNPIGYNSFLKFLRSIEDNLTKMQVQKISLSKGTGSGDQISSDVLTIQVYVR